MKLIDSHCHLNYDFTPKTAAMLVEEAKAAGVENLITIGTDLKSLSEVVALSEQFPDVYHTVGVHPHEARLLADAELAKLRAAASHPKCRAIGEIGLDYFYKHATKEDQLVCVKQQLNIALECNQPVVVHCRDAEEDLLNCLTSHVKGLRPEARKEAKPEARKEMPPGVIHCFTGSMEFGKACMALGFYISFSGIVTFKNSENLRVAAQEFPLCQLLVETDSPFLAPVPFRGKKCEPAMVRQTAQKLAELKGVSLEQVAFATTENAKKLFRIS